MRKLIYMIKQMALAVFMGLMGWAVFGLFAAMVQL